MIKILELFGGIGACSKALERLGIDYEIADYVEIDKYAVKSFNAIHNTNFEPQDITTWDKDIEVDLIMHGSPCVTADSLILTKDGYKQIIDVNVGEEVLTKSNTWHKVLKKFDNGIAPTGYLNGMGFENIHCTPNHKFYVREMYRKGHKSIRTFKEPTFKEVKDITKNDYFGIPVMQEEISFHTNDLDFWYMLGMYMGDGWLSRNSNDIIIACNDYKLEKLKSKLDINKWKYTINDNGSCWRVRFANKDIHNFIQRYIGTGSEHKHIPYEILALPKEQLQEFYNGYLDTDGCIINGKHQFSSINREMIYSFGLIINKLYHRPVCLYKIKTKPITIIEGRVVNQKDWYQLKFNPVVNKQDHAFYEDGYIWYPFKNYELDVEQHVYNMEVEEDHSYIIQGCISKNCQDFSLAGKQAGGDKDSGTRSSLMYETIRIVEKLKPKYVIWENVKNLLSKKHRHNFDAYLETMEKLGYTNYYQVLNAKDYGIPQNRERVFTVSILGNEKKYEFPKGNECNNKIDVVGNYMPSGHDASRIVDEKGLAPTVKENHGTVTAVLQRFEFPPKQELKLKLKDMLEDEVDEKYYLSDKMVEYISADNEKWTGNNDKSLINKKIASAINTGEGSRRCDASNYISKDYKENYNLKSKQKQLHSLIEKTNFEEGKVLNMDLYNQTTNENISQCLTEPHHNTQRLFDGLRIRKLTPKECWRLMGFDDEDFEKASRVNSNSQLYKQAGNSIVVNVLEAIFKELIK